MCIKTLLYDTIVLQFALENFINMFKFSILVHTVLSHSFLEVLYSLFAHIRNARATSFNSCLGKIPWWRARQPTPVFFPGESRGQRSLAGYSLWSYKELDTTDTYILHQIRSDQSLSRVRLFATPWITAHQASLSITNSPSSLRLTSIEAVMPSSHLILCRPLLLLPPIPPSIRVFSNESTLRMRWPKY